MPNILIDLLEGKSDEQKQDLVRNITRAVVDALGCDPETVNIRINEINRNTVARGGRFLDQSKG